MTAYDANGAPLTTVQNPAAGYPDFVGVATIDGSAPVKGVLVTSPLAIWGVSNVTFVISSAGQGCCP